MVTLWKSMSQVLTSHNRLLELPLSFAELTSGEKVVATDSPLGMLFVVTTVEGTEFLNDYSFINDEELPPGRPISLPLISDVQEQILASIKEQIRLLTLTKESNDRIN